MATIAERHNNIDNDNDNHDSNNNIATSSLTHHNRRRRRPEASSDDNTSIVIVSAAHASLANTSESTPHDDHQAIARPFKRVRLQEPQPADTEESHHQHHNDDQMTQSTTTSNGNGVSATATAPSSTRSTTTASNNGTLVTPESADYQGFRPIYPDSNVDRKELVRLTIQTLRDLGYENSARNLEVEAGVTLEHPSIRAFRSAVLNGDWRNAERLLIDGLNYAAAKSPSTSSAALSSTREYDGVLRDPLNKPLNSIRFLLQQQRYLELLEAGHVQKALSVLRDRLTPLHHGSERLHQLSSLVMCDSQQELRSRAGWQGSNHESRRKLLHEIELSISPSVMLPSRRLPQLLEQAQTYQKKSDPYFNSPMDSHISLYTDQKSDQSKFPSRTTHVLRGHTDEVWVMEFSRDGRYLVTGGKDGKTIMWSISADSCEKLWEETLFNTDQVTSLAWSSDGQHILVGGQEDLDTIALDGNPLKIRMHSSESMFNYPMYGMACLPEAGQSQCVIGGADGQVLFVDVQEEELPDDEREIKTEIVHTWNTAPWRISSLAVTPDGKYVVAVSWRPADATSQPVSAASHHSGHSTGTSRSLHRASSSTTSSSQNSYSSESASPMSPSGVASSGMGDHHSGSATANTAAMSSSSSHLHSTIEADLTSIGSKGLQGDGVSEARSKIHFFDIAKKEEVGAVYMMQEMTSVSISRDSRYALVNYRTNEAQVWDIEERRLVSKYLGHVLARDMIKSCFGGSQETFIVSGSEDSSIYIWSRSTGQLLERLTGHGPGTVNAVAWNPAIPSMLASCSDDHTIRIWQPYASDKPSVSPSLPPQTTTTTSTTTSTTERTLAPFPWSMSPARAASPESGSAAASRTAPLVFLTDESESHSNEASLAASSASARMQLDFGMM
ncbi:unnamed protein product [Sympodiomycopsis kandeliae]